MCEEKDISKNSADNLILETNHIAQNIVSGASRLYACNMTSVEDVEKTVENIESYADTVNIHLKYIKAKLAMFNAKRNAPKRSQALDDCDKILRKLDSIRDIICRSIEGDNDVVCTETGAETISRWLEPMIEKLPHLAETAYVVEGKW